MCCEDDVDVDIDDVEKKGEKENPTYYCYYCHVVHVLESQKQPIHCMNLRHACLAIDQLHPAYVAFPYEISSLFLPFPFVCINTYEVKLVIGGRLGMQGEK